MNEQLAEMLATRQAVYERHRHAGAVSAQELAGLAGVSGRCVANVVVIKDRDGYAMAVPPAASLLDLDRLKGLIGHGDVRLATVEEIEGVTRGVPAGATTALLGPATDVSQAARRAPRR